MSEKFEWEVETSEGQRAAEEELREAHREYEESDRECRDAKDRTTKAKRRLLQAVLALHGVYSYEEFIRRSESITAKKRSWVLRLLNAARFAVEAEILDEPEDWNSEDGDFTATPMPEISAMAEAWRPFADMELDPEGNIRAGLLKSVRETKALPSKREIQRHLGGEPLLRICLDDDHVPEHVLVREALRLLRVFAPYSSYAEDTLNTVLTQLRERRVLRMAFGGRLRFVPKGAVRDMDAEAEDERLRVAIERENAREERVTTREEERERQAVLDHVVVLEGDPALKSYGLYRARVARRRRRNPALEVERERTATEWLKRRLVDPLHIQEDTGCTRAHRERQDGPGRAFG